MNYYELLEVSPYASPEVIRAAYKSLMQRYHPDRHPDNAGMAARSVQIAQAYRVLSDKTTRAEYDRALQTATRMQRVAPVATANAWSWGGMVASGLLGAMLLGGYFGLPDAMPPEVELQTLRASLHDPALTLPQIQAKQRRIAAILAAHPVLQQQEMRKQAQQLAARSVPHFITQLTVSLRVPPLVADAASHIPADVTLLIPSITVQLGSFDADKFSTHIQNNQSFISEKLSEKLTRLQYDQLLKPDAEKYLKQVILDALNEITHTNRHERYPATASESPSHYGVVAVSLPDAFVVR